MPAALRGTLPNRSVKPPSEEAEIHRGRHGTGGGGGGWHGA